MDAQINATQTDQERQEKREGKEIEPEVPEFNPGRDPCLE
jgi:hypothetical protein